MDPTMVVDAVTDVDLEALPVERLEAEISGWNAPVVGGDVPLVAPGR